MARPKMFPNMQLLDGRRMPSFGLGVYRCRGGGKQVGWWFRAPKIKGFISRYEFICKSLYPIYIFVILYCCRLCIYIIYMIRLSETRSEYIHMELVGGWCPSRKGESRTCENDEGHMWWHSHRIHVWYIYLHLVDFYGYMDPMGILHGGIDKGAENIF